YVFFFSSRRRHTRCYRDWSSDVCSSDLDLRVSRTRGGPGVGLAFLRFGAQGRKPPILGVKYQRRTTIWSDRALPGVHPILLPIIMNRSGIDLGVGLDRLLEDCEGFFLRVKWLSGELGRSLQGRVSRCKPISVQVRIAQGRAR